ncbi:proteoglycan Cow [Agrilus planipennis]|uniref:Proteoglycan Cow n=1 Tax=Agrilus planipennis TaxID=224129 RepID=A0A1W4WCW2_AGRPL|nr:proteoglycan Cow [Agrilus planipennis]
MKLWLAVLLVVLVASSSEAKRKRKFEGDFEFAEEDETKAPKVGTKKKWIHDPSSDLCRPLNCKKKDLCLLEDAFTAVCVSKKDIEKNGDIIIPKSSAFTDEVNKRHQGSRDDDFDDDIFYDTEDDPDDDSDEDSNDASTCKPCPVVKPTFLCGVDNRTYSSLCRLEYHNCIHQTAIKVVCKGFCPCKDNDIHLRKKQRQSERLNSFMNKYKATLNKSGASNGNLNSEKPPHHLASQDGSAMGNGEGGVSANADKYTFTPQDFKFANKHYKYIKYTKYNKDPNNLLYVEDKERQRGFNEVTDNKIYGSVASGDDVGSETTPNKQCSTVALQTMGNRLLDWFSVVMADSSKRRRVHTKSKVHFPPLCKLEVRWMFQHLDLNGDSRLSLEELYDLEHDQSEICMRPFLQQCDADRDVFVTPSEWCRCFQRTERPCAAVKRKITMEMQGVYTPSCDSQGYYKPMQCHTAIGMCWCVDKHGVEFANTRTHAKPNCDAIINKVNDLGKVVNSNSVDDIRDDEDDDDSDAEGSADHPVDY